MPWTKKDYPNSMKNLDNDTRLKAIDILNAMLSEGYDEDNAIPISISEAKSWVKDASKKELKDLKSKDLTKHEDDPDNTSSRLQDADVEVYYQEDKKQWAVESVGAKQVASYHDTKKEALESAQHTADNRESKVISYKKDEKRK